MTVKIETWTVQTTQMRCDNNSATIFKAKVGDSGWQRLAKALDTVLLIFPHSILQDNMKLINRSSCIVCIDCSRSRILSVHVLGCFIVFSFFSVVVVYVSIYIVFLSLLY